MAIPVLVLGESGTGKTASMRNFKSDELALIKVVNKPLPFKGSFNELSSDSYREIIKFIRDCDEQIIVIDDCQYLMANAFMRRATEKGFDKFTEIAQDYWNLINVITTEIDPSKIVYMLSHIDRNDNGFEKCKTIGKMLDEKITVEGMFSIVLKTCVKDGAYFFETQNNGRDTVKSPMNLFPELIDNDLKFVDEEIRIYYGLAHEEVDEPIEEEDELEEMVEEEDSEEDIQEESPVVKTEPQPRERKSRKPRN